MSYWDEKAKRVAVADRHALYEEDEDGFEFRGFGNESDAQDHGFMAGARWQRKVLLDGVTVERAARNRDVIAVGEDSGADPEWVVRTVIEAVLTAALGEDEGDE